MLPVYVRTIKGVARAIEARETWHVVSSGLH